MGKTETKCPWCGNVVTDKEVKIKRVANEQGAAVERRCPKCRQVLASYVEGEGDFLSKIRTF